MRRVVRGASTEAIEYALALIPHRIRDRIGAVDFLVGADPAFVGLHRFRGINDGRSYATTAHVAYPYHQTSLLRPDRRTTVVVPVPQREAFAVGTIVHELGHVLHEHVGFHWAAVACTEYAMTNSHEAFAEAFAAWAMPSCSPLRRRKLRAKNWDWPNARDYIHRYDARTVALFETLAR